MDKFDRELRDSLAKQCAVKEWNNPQSSPHCQYTDDIIRIYSMGWDAARANSVRVRSMKKIIIFLTSFFAVGCSKEAISIVQSNNPNFKVEFLFEQDSCKVYRFYDEGRSHYFTNCTETISTQTYQCGKTQCKRSESVRSK